MSEKFEVPKIGRPKKITATIINKLEYAYTRGMSDSEACLFAGITKPTLYNYRKDNEENAERFDVLKENVKMHAKLNIAEAVIAEKNIEISKFVLEKLSEEYKKSKLTVDGKVSSGVVVNFIDDIKEDDKEEIFGVKESDIL